MSTIFRNYSPRHIQLNFAGFPILNYGPGSFVKIRRMKPSFVLEMGSGGDGTRVQSLDQSGEVEIVVMTASPTNDFLSSRVILDEKDLSGYGQFFFKDLNSLSAAKSAQAWVVQPPDMEYGDAHGMRTWLIQTHELKLYAGGSVR